MISRRDLLASATAAGLAAGLPARAAVATPPDLLDSVDPMIGTGGHGHVYPGATLPFGMVQLSPDTDNARWDASSGYYYADKTLLGFSHSHLSGTGGGDMMDLLVVPFTGEVCLRPGTVEAPEGSYRTRLDHAGEIARPGYYSLILPESGIHCELTAAMRAGLHRYTFPAGSRTRLLLDWRHGAQADEASRRLHHHLGDLLVEVAHHRLGVVERQPVGEQLRHRRDGLARDTHGAHVLDAPRHAPAAVGHGAVDLARDHHVAVARVRVGHRRPRHVAVPAGVRWKILGDDVRVYVDAIAHARGL